MSVSISASEDVLVIDECAPLTIGGSASDAAALKSAIVKIILPPDASMIIACDMYVENAFLCLSLCAKTMRDKLSEIWLRKCSVYTRPINAKALETGLGASFITRAVC